MSGNPIDLVSGGVPTFARGALACEVIDQSPDPIDFNVTQCEYAEFYEPLGEPELGFLFVCEMNNAMAEGLGRDLELNRRPDRFVLPFCQWAPCPSRAAGALGNG
jgi:hypothetical protein